MKAAQALLIIGLLWGQADWTAYKKAKRSSDKMRILYSIGMHHLHENKLDSLNKVIRLAEQHTSLEARVVYYLLQAEVALREGEGTAMKDYLLYAEKIAIQSDDIFWPIQAYRVKGAMCESIGNWEAAEAAYRKMATLSQDALYQEGIDQAHNLLERLKTLRASAL
ncbi:MAG: hypothetical protein ACUVRD_00630 [Bacteroidia bacterium]